VKIRLEGTKGECAVAAELISHALTVLSVSEPYKNRGTSALVRVYVETRIPASQPSPASRKEIGP
jgi:hypothetical protein